MRTTPEREQEIRDRLGRSGFGAKRDIRGVAALVGDEKLLAVLVVLWRRRGWVLAATDIGLRMSWRSTILGRPSDVSLDWADLRRVAVTSKGVDLEFEDRVLSLWAAGPSEEFGRLLDAARRALGQDTISVAELRDLARLKLGRMLAFGQEAEYAKLPELLQEGERVERLALAKLDFGGMLVLTDRRLMLLKTHSDGTRRLWSVDRGRVLAAHEVDGGLRLRTTEGEVTLTDVLPPERLDEFRVATPRPGAV